MSKVKIAGPVRSLMSSLMTDFDLQLSHGEGENHPKSCSLTFITSAYHAFMGSIQSILWRDSSEWQFWLLFPKTWVQYTRAIMLLINGHDSSSRGFDALFWLLQAPGIRVVYRHLYRQNTSTLKIIIKVKWMLL